MSQSPPVPGPAPSGKVWRTKPDPDIAGSQLYICDGTAPNTIFVVALVEEGRPEWAVLMLDADLEHTLDHEVDGEVLCTAPDLQDAKSAVD